MPFKASSVARCSLKSQNETRQNWICFVEMCNVNKSSAHVHAGISIKSMRKSENMLIKMAIVCKASWNLLTTFQPLCFTFIRCALVNIQQRIETQADRYRNTHSIETKGKQQKMCNWIWSKMERKKTTVQKHMHTHSGGIDCLN